MIAQGWYLQATPEPISGTKTVSETLRVADSKGYKAVRIEIENGADIYRKIAGEWTYFAFVA